MVKRGQEFRFALKASHALGVVREFVGQNFDGYIAPELGVPRAINFTHPAGTNSRENFVGA
jgi:hypothetical protein